MHSEVPFAILVSMQTPTPGFYYHYKHDPVGEINNYAYEVLNIAHHTEIDGLDESAMVVYRPLYESSVYKAGGHWDARPLGSFMEPVLRESKEIERFSKIIDPVVTAALEKIKGQMYL